MELEITDATLRRLAEGEGDGRYPAGIAQRFRDRITAIVGAPDEQYFYQIKSLHYEKLSGDRAHERSMRLNQQWRLILEIVDQPSGKRVIVKAIEDYH